MISIESRYLFRAINEALARSTPIRIEPSRAMLTIKRSAEAA